MRGLGAILATVAVVAVLAATPSAIAAQSSSGPTFTDMSVSGGQHPSANVSSLQNPVSDPAPTPVAQGAVREKVCEVYGRPAGPLSAERPVRDQLAVAGALVEGDHYYL